MLDIILYSLWLFYLKFLGIFVFGQVGILGVLFWRHIVSPLLIAIGDIFYIKALKNKWLDGKRKIRRKVKKHL